MKYGLVESLRLLQLFVGGVIHAVVNLRIRNLVLTTLVHAFINCSLTVIETPSSFRFFSLLVTVLIALAWLILFPEKNKILIRRLSPT